MIVNELRIGNLVHDEVLGNAPISGIADRSVWVSVNNLTIDNKIETVNYHLSIENVQPIPITDELLIRFGFEKSYESNFTKRFELIAKRKAFVFSYSKTDMVEDYFEVKGMVLELPQYIHTLQNIFYALTQEELIFNK